MADQSFSTSQGLCSFRWLQVPHTTTAPPRLQQAFTVVHFAGPNNPTHSSVEWRDVPVEVEKVGNAEQPPETKR